MKHRSSIGIVGQLVVLVFAGVAPLVAQEIPGPAAGQSGEAPPKAATPTPSADPGAASPAKGQRYVLDPDHTSVVFAVTHFGTSYTYGRFNRCRGEFRVNDQQVPDSFEFEIEAASIDTNNVQRDEYLRGPEFFDVQQFPRIRFDGMKVIPQEDSNPPQYRVVGQMTIRGVTRRLEMPLTQVGAGPGPFGKHRIGYFAKFSLRRSEYGMEAMPRQIGDQVTVTFSFEGIRSELVEGP